MAKTYSKEIMGHFKNPQNVGKMKNYDGLGKVGNPHCGDIMWFYIKIKRDKQGKEIIDRTSFSTLGCTVAIANSSLLTTLAKGKTLKEAMKITKKDLAKRLGDVPLFKLHCSFLAVDALSEAIYDYLQKNNKKIPEDLKKRHQRIVKERELIKEKYKDWIETEEKMLGK